MDVRLEPLIERAPGWLQAGAPEGDVVVASRVRLARNLARTRFPQQLPEAEASALCQRARKRAADWFEEPIVLVPQDLDVPEREFLIERSLASRDLLEAVRPTLVFFTAAETVGLMVNEEDHFRIQGMAPGLQFEPVIRAAKSVALQLGRSFEMATHERFGFLTACPTNLGTGLRASVLLHLPALGRARAPLEKAIKTAQRSQLAVRGVHGEGSGSLGDLFQISNQRTLGTDLKGQVRQVRSFAEQLVAYEREIRGQLIDGKEHRERLASGVEEASSTLRTATALPTQAALQCLSTLRLAALGGLLGGLDQEFDPQVLLEQSFLLQPGHLQARFGRLLSADERDRQRARLLREALGLPFEA